MANVGHVLAASAALSVWVCSASADTPNVESQEQAAKNPAALVGTWTSGGFNASSFKLFSRNYVFGSEAGVWSFESDASGGYVVW